MNKINFIKKYIIVFLIPVICMLIHMALTKCYPFGDHTILLMDANQQYVSFFKELYNKVASGESILFSWNSGMGYDFYANFGYYLGSPFAWIALLFGKDYMELGMVVSMLLQLGGCGVTSLYYFVHTDKNIFLKEKYKDIICILFATAYSMCGYILAYQYNLMWLISLMLMPLVLLGIERLVSMGDVRLYFVTLCLAFLTNYYFSWFVCLFSVVWFIDQKKETVKNAIRVFVRYVACSIVSAMCAAFMLLPCYLSVLAREDQYIDLKETGMGVLGNIGNFLQGMFWAGDHDSMGADLFVNNNYFGIFALVFAVFFFFHPDISLGQKIKRALEIIFLSFSLNWVVTIYLFHGFSFPHMFANRFAFLLIFILIITGFEGIQILEKVRYRYIAGVLVALFAIVCTIFLTGDSPVEFYAYLATILIMGYLIICLVLYKRKSIKLGSLYVNIMIIGFVELISNFFIINADSFDEYRERMIYADQWSDRYDDMSKAEGERNTAWMYDKNCFTYSETNIFASAINSDMVWFFKNLGLTYQSNGGSYIFRGTTPLMSSLFNVRNVLTNQPSYYGGYRLVEECNLVGADGLESYGIYSADYLAGFGFMLPESVTGWSMEGNPFEVQNYFTREILEEGDIFSRFYVEEPELFYTNCRITEYTENTISYHNIGLDPSISARVGMYFVIPYDMHLYVYAADEMSTRIVVEIDGKTVLVGTYGCPGTMVDLGELKAGQNVAFSVFNDSTILDQGTSYIDFYIYHDDVMQACLEDLKTSVFELEEFRTLNIKGSVSAAEDGILYLSVPAYRGFVVYVDDEETQIVKIGNAMLGIPVTEGEHEIELRYFPYGLKTGLFISTAGVLMVCMYCLNRKKRKESKAIL